MTLYPIRTISVGIERPEVDVYEFAVNVENLQRWASGLATSGVRDGDEWVAQTEIGEVRIRFVPRNDLGLLDHYVTLPDGGIVYSPMRAIANGRGSELSFTLFRLPEMTDESYEQDAATVEKDLHTLKGLLEG